MSLQAGMGGSEGGVYFKLHVIERMHTTLLIQLFLCVNVDTLLFSWLQHLNGSVKTSDLSAT